ncbi:unnamed protein product [Hymenolepis diminuta]|uniref:Uncharacterized protein n=1 Tax=Hymenolepis diminuta TaxID=6216 RepID=A0A564ZG06_HYMDI|nr:unnamed protein product [Hymenolepis diminuta]
MTNFSRGSLLIDFDAKATHLVHKISASIPQSAQFMAQPSPSFKQKSSSLCQL